MGDEQEDPEDLRISEPPPHLRPRENYIPPEQDCDDLEKIVVAPVYRGRLEESHEQSRRAWRRRSWLVIKYQKLCRNFNDFMNEHAQLIFTALTYLIGTIMVIILGILMLQTLLSKPRPYPV